ncbi:MAG: response regulator [Desulfovibrionaceae bacterium]|nr:response regulator [Desulfovibrionaceae bacterium]
MPPGGRKILFVDDDPETLASYGRALRRKYDLETALGPVRGLEAVAENGPYAVVVSDLRMPGMDGVEFFSRLRKSCPDTVRIMLTGYADIRSAMDAVNTGHVFRFLAKPCAEEELDAALTAALEQYGLVTAERTFLKGTLRGTIKVLTDLLALLNAKAQGRSVRVKRIVLDVAGYLGVPEPWRLELAVMLSQIGCAVLPERMLADMLATGGLDSRRQRLFDQHPRIAGDLLVNIPRLDEVAEIIRYQERRYDGSGPPAGGPKGQDIPFGSRLLKVALDYDTLIASGRTKAQALAVMGERAGWYDPRVFEAFATLAQGREGFTRTRVPPEDVVPGMVLVDDLIVGGETVAAAGTAVDHDLAARIARAGEGFPEAVPMYVSPETESTLFRLEPDLIEMLRRERRDGDN